MESSRDGERNGYAENPAPTPTPTPAAYRQGASQSQLEPHSQRAVDEALFRFQTGFDFETLESSFGGLSFVDSTVRRHQQNPLLDNHWINRSSASSSSSSSLHQNQGINVGGDDDVGGDDGDWYRDTQQMINHYKNMLLQNFYVNERSYANPMTTFNNGFGFLNGNSQDVPYMYLSSRQPHWDNNNGVGSLRRWNNNNEGFLNSHEQSLSLENVTMESFALLARVRNSSFFLQKKIEVGSKETIDEIFNDFIFHIFELMVDPVASHVLQKLMVKCSSEQITQIVDLITRQQFLFVSICTHDVGTRSIQSLVKCLHTREQIMRLVGAVSMGTLALSRNNHAKHVMVQCLKEFHPSLTRILLEAIAQNCYQIAVDQHGCLMLQECLRPRGTCPVVKAHLIHAIIANALRLCLDSYGNYVVQYVVELADPNVLLSLVQQLLGNYAFLSRDKYGSHAVQKLLKIKCIDPSIIIYDLLPEFDTLLLDTFGNFVVQTAWSVCKDELRILLMRHIERNRPFMRCNKYGNKILEKLNL